MAADVYNILFDNGIEKALQGESPAPLTHEISISGNENSDSSYGLYLKPVFKSGYVLNTATGGGVLEGEVTFTSKQSVSRKSVDLTSLTGWDSLSTGTHTITVKAKASGYKDSEPSSTVAVTKGETSETWVLNETGIAGGQGGDFTIPTMAINFSSNDTIYSALFVGYNTESPDDYTIIKYGDSEVYGNSGWKNEAYRTITFSTAPSGDLLTWLQANGTKLQKGDITSFKLQNNFYTCLYGMTWEQWVNSEYNTSNYILSDSDNRVWKTDAYTDYVSHNSPDGVSKTDVIQPTWVYVDWNIYQ